MLEGKGKAVTAWASGLGLSALLLVGIANSSGNAQRELETCSFTDADGKVTTWLCETAGDTTTTQPPTTTEPPVTTTTEPPVTTTTEPPVTTTTEPPVTTTTEPPVTTTTEPPTTTTTEPPLGQDPPPPDGPKFDVIVNGDSGDGPQRMWTAPYYHSLPHGCIFTVGDRVGYTNDYLFMWCEGEPVLRIMFAGGYIGGANSMINQQGGTGRLHYYDGTPGAIGARQLNDAPRPEPFGPYNGPSDPPTIRIVENSTNEVEEVRDYKGAVGAFNPPTPLLRNVTFNGVQHITESFTDSSAPISAPHTVFERFIVGAYIDGMEAVNVYYDILDPAYRLVVQDG